MRKKGEELLLFLFTASVYCFICFYLPYKYPELPKSLSVSVEAVIPGGHGCMLDHEDEFIYELRSFF